MRLKILVVALLLPVAPAYAADAPFSFMGRSIGDPLSKWKSTLDINDSVGWCKKPDALGLKRCKDKSLEQKGMSEKIGSAYVNWLYWLFLDDKIAGFELSGQWAGVEPLRNMLIGKFGPPDEASGDVLVWRTANGPLVLQRDRGKSILGIFDESAERVIGERRAGKAASDRDAGKQVF